jgi:sphingomyelin phosphodiesterase 2
VWSHYDFIKIKERIKDNYPHSHFFYSGVLGSGLCFFSKHKIISVFFHHWAVNGYVHKIQHGDWFGGKGVGLAKIKIFDHVINFYIAHLHAEYDKNNDEYMAHRVIQAYDTAQFLENTKGDCSMQILAGDLNIEPDSLAYRLLLSTSGMKDSFVEKPSKFFATNEYSDNSYTTKSDDKKEGIRIDYILYRNSRDFNFEVEKYELPLLEKIPELNLSYSDHEAVHVKFAIQARKSELNFPLESRANQQDENRIKDLKESIATCNKCLKELEYHRKSYCMMAIGLIVILINVVEIKAGYGLGTIYMIVKFLLSGLTLFFIFMASLWNTIETNGILSGKLAMEIAMSNNEVALYQ